MHDASYKCSDCGAKQSAAKGRVVKIQGHHCPEIDLEPIIDSIVELLKAPQVPMCKKCHDVITKKNRKLQSGE